MTIRVVNPYANLWGVILTQLPERLNGIPEVRSSIFLVSLNEGTTFGIFNQVVPSFLCHQLAIELKVKVCFGIYGDQPLVSGKIVQHAGNPRRDFADSPDYKLTGIAFISS